MQFYSRSSVDKESAAMQETSVRFLGREDPLEKEMAAHSSILAWTSPWTEEPGGLQSIESQKVGHDWSDLARIPHGWSIGASTSASALPMSIHGWFPLRLTGLISLLSKGLSRVFSSTTVWKHQLLGTQPLYGPALTSIHDCWKNHSLDYMDLGWQSDVAFHLLKTTTVLLEMFQS